MHFTKMNGTGNDYIYFYLENDKKNELFNKNFIIKLCNRHTGIGGDGVVLINQSTHADAKMIIFNADGSRAEMCGNALRCVAAYLYSNKIVTCNNISIDTDCGLKYAEISLTNNLVTVNIGKPKSDFNLFQINTEISGYNLNIGNPHFVVLTNDIDKQFEEYAETISNATEYFPNKTNVEFVQILDNPNSARIRVFERGSKETMSCGTGAAAVFAIIHKLNLVGDEVFLHLKGGVLHCKYNFLNEILLTGNAELNFEGNIDIKRGTYAKN